MTHRGRFAAAVTARIAPSLPAAPGLVTIGIVDDAPAILAAR